MGVDLLGHVVGEDGSEPPAGQHWHPLIVEIYG